MRFVFLIGIFVVIFLVIWILTYAFHRASVRVASWLVWGTSAIVLLLSGFWLLMDILFAHKTSAFGMSLESMSNIVGALSLVWSFAAVFIFFSKRLFRQVHNRHMNDHDVIRRIMMLAKKHHNLFGWVTLIAAGVHGFYFFLHAPKSWYEFYTGIGAWIALALLAITGMTMSKVAKVPERAKIIRQSHVILTIGYAAAIILHVPGSIFLGVVLFGAAFIAMGIMWGGMRLQASSGKKH
jgi:hypothetical protein